MSEEKEAQLSIIYMYTQTGENDGMDSWEKTYSCDQQLTPVECEVLTQVSYVFCFPIFL